MKFNIKVATEEDSVEWTNWYDDIEEVGDTFSLELARVSYNAEKNAIYLIGEETATTVYTEHHESSKYKTSTTHGIRVVNAIARMLKLSGEVEADSLFEGLDLVMADKKLTVTAEKTAKGLLWTIA